MPAPTIAMSALISSCMRAASLARDLFHITAKIGMEQRTGVACPSALGTDFGRVISHGSVD
jgi:hypothetical protein